LLTAILKANGDTRKDGGRKRKRNRRKIIGHENEVCMTMHRPELREVEKRVW
jgi:hypothetical protein